MVQTPPRQGFVSLPAHGFWKFLLSGCDRRTQQIATAGHGDAAGASHFKNAEGTQDFEQAVDLVHGTGYFENQGFWSDVHDTSPKNFDELHQMRARLLIGEHFD
jgi:hypothetical protein